MQQLPFVVSLSRHERQLRPDHAYMNC